MIDRSQHILVVLETQRNSSHPLAQWWTDDNHTFLHRANKTDVFVSSGTNTCH